MEKVVGPKNDSLGFTCGVKGQYDQKKVKYLVGKLMTPAIHLRQNNMILTSLWGSNWESKSKVK
jgi:hypothetical protein